MSTGPPQSASLFWADLKGCVVHVYVHVLKIGLGHGWRVISSE